MPKLTHILNRCFIAASMAAFAVVANAQTMPRIDPKDLNAKAMPPIDLEALTQRYEAAAAAAKENGTVDGQVPSGVFVFVSFGMPKAVLQRIVEQAERVNATLVLRGLVDRSIPKTAASAKDMLGTHRVAWMIDPRLFKMYQVQQVPATVLVQPGTSAQFCQDQQCNKLPDYVKVSGDVSIRYALEEMSRSAPPDLASLATTYLERFDEFRTKP